MADVSSSASAYRLVRPAARPVAVPVLDTAQQEVVDHRGGPLLVLAGPGTGKTTTVVEAVVARIDGRRRPRAGAGAHLRPPGRGRAARRASPPGSAGPPRSRWPAPSTPTPSACCAARRRPAASRRPGCWPARSRTSWSATCWPATSRPGAVDWPDRLRAALATRGFAQELRDLVMRAYERGVTADELDRLGRVQGRDDWRAAARFMRQYAGVTALQDAASYDPAELIRAVVGLWLREPALLAAEQAARPHVFVDELQDTDPAQVELLTLLSGQGRDLVAVGDPDQSIYGFRGADVTGIRELPRPVPHRRPTPRRRSSRSAPAAGPGRRCSPPAAGSSRGLGGPRRHRDLLPASGLPTRRALGRRAALRGAGGRARRRPAAARPPRRRRARGRRWRCSSGRPCTRCPCCAARWSPPACRSRCPATRCR